MRESHSAPKEIALGPMLQRVSPRVTPIVEDLAPKQMAADAPLVTASLLFKPVMTAHQIVEIRYLKSGVIESALAGSQ